MQSPDVSFVDMTNSRFLFIAVSLNAQESKKKINMQNFYYKKSPATFQPLHPHASKNTSNVRLVLRLFTGIRHCLTPGIMIK
jgi:ABC-type oligopeptide transport system substrate-binding subunit